MTAIVPALNVTTLTVVPRSANHNICGTHNYKISTQQLTKLL